MKRNVFLTALLALLFLAFGLPASARGKAYAVTSPKGDLRCVVQGNRYSLWFKGQALIQDGLLGYALPHGGQTAHGKPTLLERRNVRSEWRPLWGKRSVVPDRYRLLRLRYPGGMQLEVRAYDEGLAFRYTEVPTDAVQELTQFAFAGNYRAWYYNGENHNLGPEPLDETNGPRHPVMTVEAAPAAFLALHEADLREAEPMVLSSSCGSLTFTIASRPNRCPTSAWRVLLTGATPGALVDSHLLELLCPEPSQDFSWVKPGLAVWDWRIDGAVYDGYRYRMDYPSWVRMIDFAARHRFRHLVLDANWYGPEFEKDSDPMQGGKAQDVKRIIAYGQSKGVGVWLYLNDVGGTNYPIGDIIRQYAQWGAAGIKYGFMTGSPAEKNARTQRITRLCAENRLLINFHDGPVHPFGQSRTWPNAVTREYGKAQLDGHQVMQPKTVLTSCFVNMLAGPLDQGHGMFDLRPGPTTRVDNNQPVPATLAAEAARPLITYSGVSILPDIPEFYERHPALLRFLSAQQQPWRESRTLQGRIGEYIALMRQSAEGDYLVGLATNEEGRTLSLPLDFLPRGTFSLELVTDGPRAHYLHNREIYEVETRLVRRTDRLSIPLAPGGGACLLLRRK